MTNDPMFRIRRLYEALNDAIEKELTKFSAKVWANNRSVFVVQDFSGGMSIEKMANIANTEIGLIAGLEDHLRAWAKKMKETPIALSGPLKAQSRCKYFTI